MTGLNWFGIFFAFGIPLGIIVGMIAVMIRDHLKAKKRDKRCHQVIHYWWEMKVGE